jgi:hypothetical protein
MSYRRCVVVFPFLVSLFALLAVLPRPGLAAYAPKVAVVLCQQTYDAGSQRQVHRTSQALVGLAGLVGAPYDTVMLEELLSRPATYSSIWFSDCSVLPGGLASQLADFLESHLDRGGSVLLDGPIGGSDALEDALNINFGGFQDMGSSVIRTAGGSHPLSGQPGWAPGTTLTQGLASGTNVLEIANDDVAGSATLLAFSSGDPFLVTTRPSVGRVLAISGYGSGAGPATPFRNDPPRGFFDNLLLPRLIDATVWLLSPDEPSVGLQLSHAPMTAVVRLDADVSGDSRPTEETLDYLLELAKETGVTSAYAIVSSFAEGSDWDSFEAAPELERLGGAIGSHSHTHNNNMSLQTDPAFWDREVRQSLSIIRQHFTTGSFGPPVDVFINPGGEISWGDYRRFFGSVRAFFTHGFETEVPYSTGISAFRLPAGAAPVAIINNVPVPDYQWFYDPNWLYTVDAGTENQRRILGYYQNRVGRGALFNQMWHDYAIGGEAPPSDPGRRATAHYDMVKDHFARERIFAPGIAEVTTKLNLAQRTQILARNSGGMITTTLDLSRFSAAERAQLSGMGLRVNRSSRPIVAVTLDGAAYPAFSADTVILPPTASGSLVVAAQTGDSGPVVSPRLTYVSKAFTGLSAASDSVKVDLVTPALHTRFCLALPARHIVLGADRYAPSAAETCGVIRYRSGSSGFEGRALNAPEDLSFTASDRRLVSVMSSGAVVTLAVAAGQSGDRLSFRTTAAARSVTVGGSSATPSSQGGGNYVLAINTSGATTVTFRFTEPAPPPAPAPTPTPTPPPTPTPAPPTPSPTAADPDAGTGEAPAPAAPDAGSTAGGGTSGADADLPVYPPLDRPGTMVVPKADGGAPASDGSSSTGKEQPEPEPDTVMGPHLGGGGGCSLAVTPAARTSGAGLPLALASLLLVARRRRRRPRSA